MQAYFCKAWLLSASQVFHQISAEETVSSAVLGRELVGVCLPSPGLPQPGGLEKTSGRALVERGEWEKTCSLPPFLKECCPDATAPVFKGTSKLCET